MTIETPEEEKWMSEGNKGIYSFENDKTERAGEVESRTLIRAHADRNEDDYLHSTIDLISVNRFHDEGISGTNFREARCYDPDPDADVFTNIALVDATGIVSEVATFSSSHEIGHIVVDDGDHIEDWEEDESEKWGQLDFFHSKERVFLMSYSNKLIDPEHYRIDQKKRLTPTEWQVIIEESGPGTSNEGSENIHILEPYSHLTGGHDD